MSSRGSVMCGASRDFRTLFGEWGLLQLAPEGRGAQTSQGLPSQDLRSQDLRSQDLGSQDLGSQDLTS